ncbi:hypothetical protein EAO73_35810 [Streptomyces sp. col6]|uniref:hypothetical protein n=1 Tax=Streptomyces sp. col6 TaxID=2478958 RepID=UPI0011CDFE46|nr:hypothetical protein [Streptomyces sp. col6]TXR91751.1 hypothetical protein EAO73_35810 [Streptomyces sp. col6]
MDTRLIQTAVLGDPESDEPVICPEDPEELDAFRLEHEANTWWCGINLPGGCGRRLITRRCTDKICHFAHVPDPHGSDSRLPCSRRQRKDDADHLFIKADIARWLRQQNIEADLALSEPLGSAVTARLADGRLLVVHLDTARAPAWDDEEVWEYILGPGCLISPDVLAQRGHAFRIRMEGRSDRGRRFVVAGIQRAGTHTEWFDLANLKVTAGSITTVNEEHSPQPARTPAAATGQAASGQRPADTSSPSKATAPRAGEFRPPTVRRLDSAIYEQAPGHVKTAMLSVQHVIDNESLDNDELTALRAAYGRGQRWLDQRQRRRATVIAQLRERVDAGKDPGGLARQAWDLVDEEDATDEDRAQVKAIQQQMQRVVDERREAEARRRIEAHQAALEAKQRAARERQLALDRETARKEQEARIARLKTLVPPVRGGLKRAAGNGEMRTWQELQHKTGARGLKGLSYEDRVDLLVMVGQKTPPDEPLWSVLLIAHGDQEALAMHRAVAAQLGRDVPENDGELIAQLKDQRAELHRLHR